MVAAKVLKTFGCNVRLGSSPSITTNFMNQVKISQENWMKICARLDEALEDSRRLDFVLSSGQSTFKNRAQIDQAKKASKPISND